MFFIYGRNPRRSAVCSGEFTLTITLLLVAASCLLFVLAIPAHAQQFDIAFGYGTVFANPASDATATQIAAGTHAMQSLSGGGYPSFSGDLLFWKHLGVGAEVSWRAHQNVDQFNQPFRPIFYDVIRCLNPACALPAIPRAAPANENGCALVNAAALIKLAGNFHGHVRGGQGLRQRAPAKQKLRPALLQQFIRRSMPSRPRGVFAAAPCLVAAVTAFFAAFFEVVGNVTHRSPAKCR